MRRNKTTAPTHNIKKIPKTMPYPLLAFITLFTQPSTMLSLTVTVEFLGTYIGSFIDEFELSSLPSQQEAVS